MCFTIKIWNIKYDQKQNLLKNSMYVCILKCFKNNTFWKTILFEEEENYNTAAPFVISYNKEGGWFSVVSEEVGSMRSVQILKKKIIMLTD